MTTNKVNLSFENAGGYLICRIEGKWTRDAIFQLIADIAIEARSRGYSRILVDARHLSSPPTELDRFLAGEQVAKKWHDLKAATLYSAEVINKFAETTAVNRGANIIIVSDIDEALDWLLENPDMD